MANKIPKNVSKEVRRVAYAKCEAYGYSSRSRTENTTFMNSLVDFPEIGGRLREYMTGEEVRTYIKDTILNAYAKAIVKHKLDSTEPLDVIKALYSETAAYVAKKEDTHIYRAVSGKMYVVQAGTLLKWETALRRALECVAGTPSLYENCETTGICLVLAVTNDELSYGDQCQIETALGLVGVKVFFAK